MPAYPGYNDNGERAMWDALFGRRVITETDSTSKFQFARGTLTQRLAQLNAQHATRILELENENRGLRLLVDGLMETICRLKGGDCDPDALADGFDETGGQA